jgi:hypothetical protein
MPRRPIYSDSSDFVGYLRNIEGHHLSALPTKVQEVIHDFSEQLTVLEKTGIDMHAQYGVIRGENNLQDSISLHRLREENYVMSSVMKELLRGEKPVKEPWDVLNKFWHHGINAADALEQVVKAHPGVETQKAEGLAQMLGLCGMMLNEMAGAHEAAYKVALGDTGRVITKWVQAESARTNPKRSK